MILINRTPRRNRTDSTPTVALSVKDWCAANVVCPVDRRYEVDMSRKFQLSTISGDSGTVNLSTREEKQDSDRLNDAPA